MTGQGSRRPNDTGVYKRDQTEKLQELIGYTSNTDLDTILDNVIFITDASSRCLYSLAIFTHRGYTLGVLCKTKTYSSIVARQQTGERARVCTQTVDRNP